MVKLLWMCFGLSLCAGVSLAQQRPGTPERVADRRIAETAQVSPGGSEAQRRRAAVRAATRISTDSPMPLDAEPGVGHPLSPQELAELRQQLRQLSNAAP